MRVEESEGSCHPPWAPLAQEPLWGGTTSWGQHPESCTLNPSSWWPALGKAAFMVPVGKMRVATSAYLLPWFLDNVFVLVNSFKKWKTLPTCSGLLVSLKFVPTEHVGKLVFKMTSLYDFVQVAVGLTLTSVFSVESVVFFSDQEIWFSGCSCFPNLGTPNDVVHFQRCFSLCWDLFPRGSQTIILFLSSFFLPLVFGMCICYPTDENKQSDCVIWKFQSAPCILEKLTEVPIYYYCTILQLFT